MMNCYIFLGKSSYYVRMILLNKCPVASFHQVFLICFFITKQELYNENNWKVNELQTSREILEPKFSNGLVCVVFIMILH